MSKPRSERSRWVTIHMIGKPSFTADGVSEARRAHERVQAVIDAFAKVGRVVRVEVNGDALVFKARRA